MNWIIGFTLGIAGSWWAQGAALKLKRIWIYTTVIIMTILSVAIIAMLSHNL
jgi:hypothetical protein